MKILVYYFAYIIRRLQFTKGAVKTKVLVILEKYLNSENLILKYCSKILFSPIYYLVMVI